MSQCLEHTQKGDKDGYGKLSYRGLALPAHRAVYLRRHNLNAEDIRGLVVMHTCDNPRCINPDHLVLGTPAENTRDMLCKGRGRKVCGEQHPACKLSDSDIAYARRVYKPRDREFGGAALARLFGVDQSTMSDVLNNRTHASKGTSHDSI